MSLTAAIKKTTRIFYVKTLLLLCLGTLANTANANLKLNQYKFQQNTVKSYGEKVRKKLQSWQQMVDGLQQQSELAKLRLVNEFFSKNINYRLDHMLYKQQDYWAPLNQTLALGAGDCEDFAIAKYFSLRVAGVADEKLRMIYVKAKIGSLENQAHMVLGYFASPNAEPLILDSTTDIIAPLSKRTDLIAKYSFNAKQLWIGKTNIRFQQQPELKLSKWQNIWDKSTEFSLLAS